MGGQGSKVILDSNDLYNYYFNGWNKDEELELLKALRKRSKNIINYISRYGTFIFRTERWNAWLDVWKSNRETIRLENEKRAVAILLRCLRLKKPVTKEVKR